jgi:DNA-binding IclR family transcriptional regulator
MPGLDRYLEILRLFSEVRSVWTVQDIAGATSVPVSTTYRAVRDLARNKMLEPANEGEYRLGAAFIEFDRLIRLTDPLVKAGMATLNDIARQTEVPCVAVLCRLYGDTVMCVADTRNAGSDVQTSFERGRPRPLTRGATSKAILAQLAPRRLEKLLARDAQHVTLTAAARSAFREELALIRRRGFSVTRGEVDVGRMGIAVPLSVPAQALHASLSVVLHASSVDETIERRLIAVLGEAAGRLAGEMKG